MMKGDLHTLKKVCLYGSRVMLVGTVVLFAVAVAMLGLGIGSLFSDVCSDLCRDITNDAQNVGAAMAELFVIFILATVTVLCTYRIMVSIHSEHSPFNESNTDIVKRLSLAYLPASVVLALLEFLAHGIIAPVLFVFFGCILLSVILYIFALIIRYGAVLQNESDHTL
ncbi:MAG: DUF2975 domain-containing protein [archaeon]|nr:DUF2975 domain-containing protein [archaeon]